MKLRDSLDGSIVTFELGGRVMAGDQLTALRGQVQYYLSLNKKDFIFDLQNVEWMSSAGIGALVSTHASAVKAGGQLVLANVTNIQDLLSMTRLVQVFDTYESHQEALQAIKARQLSPVVPAIDLTDHQ